MRDARSTRTGGRPAVGADGVERFVQGREDPPLSERGGDAVPPQVRQQMRVDAPEEDTDALPRQFFNQPANGLRGGEVDVGDRLRVDENGRRSVIDERADLLCDSVANVAERGPLRPAIARGQRVPL
jgi:hypothetical protein